MTTIFVENLKKLVGAQLKKRWAELKAQENAYDFGFLKLSSKVHDTALSSRQAVIIDTLEHKILAFEATGDDNKDKESIKLLITQTKKEIEDARGEHKFSDDSKTLECLEKLKNNIENFYDSLKTVAFPLLNFIYKRTPECIVYSGACHYLGLAKFNSEAHGSIDVKRAKQEKLLERLRQLKETIRPEYNLEQQRTAAIRILNDLSRDNQDIVKGVETALTTPFGSIGLSIFGGSVKISTASEGSLAKGIEIMIATIKALTVEECDCPHDAEITHGVSASA